MLNNKKPLMIKKPSVPLSQMPKSAVKAMKDKMKVMDHSDTGSRTSIPFLPPQLDYIFAIPEEPVSIKEKKLNKFLNCQGIFQIHWDAMLKHYTAEPKYSKK